MSGSTAALNLIIALKDEASAGLQSLGGLLGGLGVAAGAVAAGAIAGVGLAAIDTASQVDDAQRQMQAQLGITAAEAEALGGVALDVFGNNFAGSVSEAGAAVADLEQRLGLMGTEGPAALQAATESAFALRDVFGVETAESAAAAQTLMQEFGLSSQEAFDFLAAGYQNGLNASGDFLDSIGEYSNLFSDNGFAADEFFSVMQTGMAGGVLGTDKAADAFKEFGIRIREVTDEQLESLGDIGGVFVDQWTEGLDPTNFKDYAQTIIAQLADMGLNAEEFRGELESGAISGAAVFRDVLGAGIVDGSVSVADAYAVVSEGLQGMDNEIARNSAGIKFFGTQWEDLGASAMLGIDTAATGLEEMAGSADSLNARYGSLGDVMGGIWRQTLVALEPLGAALLALANAAMPMVLAAFAVVQPYIQMAADGLAGLAGALGGGEGGGVVAGLQATAQGMLAWVGESLPGWLGALGGFAAGLLQWVLDAAPGVIAGLADVAIGMVAWVLDSLPGWGAELLKLGLAMQQWVIDALPGLGEQLGAITVVLLQKAAEYITVIWPKLVELGASMINWVTTEVLPNMPARLLEIATAIMAGVSGFWAVVSPEITKLAEQLYNWVKDEVVPEIPGKLAELGTAISTGIAGLLETVTTAASDLGGDIVQGIADGITGAATAVADAARQAAQAALDAAKGLLGIQSPSLVFEQQVGAQIVAGLVRGLDTGRAAISAAASGLAGAAVIGASAASPAAGSLARPAAAGPVSVTVPIAIEGVAAERGGGERALLARVQAAARAGVAEALRQTSRSADIGQRIGLAVR